MKVYFVHGTNLPENVDRAFLSNTFQPYGAITKIYLNPDATWFKIYFKSKESAEEAASLNQSPPYYMQLIVESEYNYKDRQNKQSKSLHGSSNGNMHYDDSDYYASPGPDFYNIHGMPVPTLTSDDGTIYVPLNEVRQIGFELFEDCKIPKNINFKKQALDEFKIYLNIQARKYIEKMQWSKTSDKTIEDIKNEVINKYASNGPLRSTTFRQYDNVQSASSNVPPPVASKMNTDQAKIHQTGAFEKQKNTRPSPAKNIENIQAPPLRQPARNNDSISRNTQTGNSDKHRQSESDSVCSADGICSKLDKENVSPKKEETPVEQRQFLKFSQPKINQVELTLNKVAKVTVSFVESQKKCWVYKKEDEDKMRKLLYDVNIEARMKPIVQPSVGKIYAAIYEGAWYRALVREITPTLKVQYLDFGNFNEEKLKEVRELPPEITSVPMLSVQLNFTTSPQSILELDKELTIMPTIKNSDGSYDVEEVSEKPRTPESSKLNIIPAGKIITSSSVNNTNVKQAESTVKTGTVRKNKPTQNENEFKTKSPQSFPSNQNDKSSKTKSPQSFPSNQSDRSFKTKSPQSFPGNRNDRSSAPSPNLTLRERLQNMSGAQKETKNQNVNRKSVMDLIDNDSGIVQFGKRISDNTCLGFIYPVRFIDIVGSLEKMSETEEIVGRVGDFVSVFCMETNLWVRAMILNVENDVYTVVSVDYGKTFTTNKVCKLERKFVDTPEFGSILSGNAECMKLLEKNDGADFTSVQDNKMKMSFDNIFYDVTCTRWNPFESFDTTKECSSEQIYTTPPSTKELRDMERVLPVILNDEKLLVRNKESNAVLAKVKAEVSKYAASPLIQTPVVNQLVLCPHDTQTVLCRGIVKALNKNYAEVEFIDYGFTDTIPIMKIKTINEYLAKEDSSLVPIVLKGFEDGQFPDELIKFIEDCSRQSKKFAIKKCSNNVVDLIIDYLPTGEVTLSSKLARSSVTNNNRLMYKAMTACELKIGETENVMCVGIEDKSGYIKIIPNDNLPQTMCDLNEEIAKCIRTNTEPYSPIVDEICLGRFDDEWYRAAVIKVNEALEMFEVYYLEFGNVATISPVDIRKISDECLQFPSLGLTGCLKETVSHCNVSQIVLDVIKNEITVGDSYDVKVLEKLEKRKYLIEIPSLSVKLSELFNY